MLKFIKCLFIRPKKQYAGGVNQRKTISIFSYLDYRKFLLDHYQFKKKSRAGFSLRTFSKKADLGSSNLLKRVIDGERNLTEDTITKFAKGLELNKKETEFFRNLVYFCQANTHEKKDLYYQKLIRSKSYNTIKPMEKEQYDFFSTWYHSIVRELVASEKYNGHVESIAKKITPQLSTKQIEASIQLLEKIGFIKKNENGKWESLDTVVTTGPECVSVTAMNYHQNLLVMTKDKLNDVPSHERDVSSMILGVDKEFVAQIKARIQEFRQDILKMVSDQKNPGEVVVLSMQLIPYTKTWEEQDI